MIHIRTIVTIAKKEIVSFIDNPASYIAYIVFLLLWEFLFFRNAFLVGESSLRILYDYLPWVLLFFASAVTMSSFAQEKSDGTLELLLTHPVSELDVVCGKFLSNFIFIGSSLIFALPVAVTFSLFGALDWGMILGQVLASLFLAGAFVSLGLYISELLASQVAALLVTSTLSFFFIIVGTDFFTANLPLSVAPILEQLSIVSHVTSMSRGVLDLRDLWYFLTFVLIFFALTYLGLLARKYGNRKDYYRNFQIATTLFIAIVILTNSIGSRIPGRLDLTHGKQYTVSGATVKTIGSLSDIVSITVYISGKLPTQFVPVARDVRDTLRDYVQLSHGNIQVTYKDPSNNTTLAQEAQNQGIQEMQFNVIGNEEFQLKTGYLGLVISYAGTHESIPFIQNTGDLEYQLTSLIAKLTTKEKKTIAFLSGHGEKSLTTDYRILNQELSKQFQTKTVGIDDTSPLVATDSSVLVIAGPTTELSQVTRNAVKQYIASGKGVLFLIDQFKISSQTPQAVPNQNSLADFVKTFGVSINPDIVYDLRSNQTIQMGQSGMGFLLPYPFWLRASGDESSPVSNRISDLTLPWSSSVSPDTNALTKEGYDVHPLLTTSRYAGVQTGTVSISPTIANFSRDNLAIHTLGVVLSPRPQTGIQAKGRIVIIGNSLFLTDQFMQNATQNLSLGISTISWLAAQDSLSGIRIKTAGPGKLLFTDTNQQTIIKYFNLLLAIILPAGIGVIRQLRRRHLRNVVYREKI